VQIYIAGWFSGNGQPAASQPQLPSLQWQVVAEFGWLAAGLLAVHWLFELRQKKPRDVRCSSGTR